MASQNSSSNMSASIINHEWATRPADERFLTVEELHQYNVAKDTRSTERGLALDLLQVGAAGGDMVIYDPRKVSEGVKPARLNHWAFGQLCSRIGAPASYLRSLPAQVAEIPLSWSMQAAGRDDTDAKALVRRSEGGGLVTVAALTSGSYGRVWDSEVTDAILKRVDLSVWRVPSEGRQMVGAQAPHHEVTKRNTTLYASDRDCFLALVDEDHPITVPGEQANRLHRGVIVRNSEVGRAKLEVWMFLYEFICANRLIWGLSKSERIEIRHTSGAPHRFIGEVQPALQRYLTSGTREIEAGIQRAQDKVLGKTDADVLSWLQQKKFTSSQAQAAIDAAREADGNPRSLWGIVNGLTRSAQDVQYGDERFDLERQAGKLLDVVAE